MERTKMTYACLAKVVRDGGFKIALIARLSAIPGHCEGFVVFPQTLLNCEGIA